jgi:hypothetical protein
VLLLDNSSELFDEGTVLVSGELEVSQLSRGQCRNALVFAPRRCDPMHELIVYLKLDLRVARNHTRTTGRL